MDIHINRNENGYRGMLRISASLFLSRSDSDCWFQISEKVKIPHQEILKTFRACSNARGQV